MSAPVTSPPSAESAPVPQRPWSPDVDAYAASQQVDQYLMPLWEATRRIFPTANWVKVHVDKDPEIRDLRWIVFDVQVKGLSRTEAVAVNRQWIQELLRCCPTTKAHHFTLLLDQQD
jgi:hypothetical protein